MNTILGLVLIIILIFLIGTVVGGMALPPITPLHVLAVLAYSGFAIFPALLLGLAFGAGFMRP